MYNFCPNHTQPPNEHWQNNNRSNFPLCSVVKRAVFSIEQLVLVVGKNKVFLLFAEFARVHKHVIIHKCMHICIWNSEQNYNDNDSCDCNLHLNNYALFTVQNWIKRERGSIKRNVPCLELKHI